jgi:predicted tellurium resistance membrane protein TerC
MPHSTFMAFEIFAHPEAWISLATLTFMEVVLGIDNIIFISLVANRLPREQQAKARALGLTLALVFRIGLLLSIKWIVGLKEPLFFIGEYGVSGRGLILMAGGMFLLAKSTSEIFHKVEGETSELVKEHGAKSVTFSSVILQIVMLDIVFSFDSILTAVGLTDQILIMVMAVIIAMMIMMLFAGPVSNFINKYPSLQILALSFLLLIGFMLVLEGLPEQLSLHVPKGYIYFAVFFSLFVEMINIRLIRKKKPA